MISSSEKLENSSSSLESVLPQGWQDWPQEALEEFFLQLKAISASQVMDKSLPSEERKFSSYQPFPEKFASQVLGRTWWSGQHQLGRAIRDNNRIAVKGGHSVGKSYAIADLCIWFLHAYYPARVITTAPSGEQVRNEIWRYMRNGLASAKEPLFPGIKPKDPFWDISDDHFAQGISTDTGGRFRGKHCENMLIVLDEANGCPSWAWEEAENMCTAPNNKIVASGNPIEPGGNFYDCFKSDSWAQVSLSCLDHPNVLQGRMVIPGAVSRQWVQDRVNKFCAPLDSVADVVSGDFEWPRGSGCWFRPSATFQGRVLGEFPSEGPDTLIPLRMVDRAKKNALLIDETAPIDLGVDVAYKGGDWCVVFARQGPSVISRRKWQGMDPDKSKREVAAMIRDFTMNGHRVGTVAVDAIGIGSGLAHGLRAMREDKIIHCDRVLAVQVSEKASDNKKYANKRTELAFALAERFRGETIDLSRLPETVVADFEYEATAIHRGYDQLLRYKLESKDDIRDRLRRSPDDFDAMMLCFIDTCDTFAENYAAAMIAD